MAYVTASEWHDNHHNYPFSANDGFAAEIDFAFLIVKWMCRVGIVRSYVDAMALFEKKCLGLLAVDKATMVAR
jgi:fatty-acid desaturase